MTGSNQSLYSKYEVYGCTLGMSTLVRIMLVSGGICQAIKLAFRFARTYGPPSSKDSLGLLGKEALIDLLCLVLDGWLVAVLVLAALESQVLWALGVVALIGAADYVSKQYRSFTVPWNLVLVHFTNCWMLLYFLFQVAAI